MDKNLSILDIQYFFLFYHIFALSSTWGGVQAFGRGRTCVSSARRTPASPLLIVDVPPGLRRLRSRARDFQGWAGDVCRRRGNRSTLSETRSQTQTGSGYRHEKEKRLRSPGQKTVVSRAKDRGLLGERPWSLGNVPPITRSRHPVPAGASNRDLPVLRLIHVLRNGVCGVGQTRSDPVSRWYTFCLTSEMPPCLPSVGRFLKIPVDFKPYCMV